jgi:hypothetical protein
MEKSCSWSQSRFPPWDDIQIMDTLRHDIATKTWRWQDRRNMRLVCRRWREAVLLPQLFLDTIGEKDEVEGAISRTSFLRVHHDATEGAKLHLGPALVHNRTVVELLIGNVNMTKPMFESLAAAISVNRTLRRVQIQYPGPRATPLIAALAQNYSITTFILDGFDWDVEFLQAFTKALTDNPTPRFLSLKSANRPKAKSGAELGAMIRSPSLTGLSLKQCFLKENGKVGITGVLADAIIASKSLKKLSLTSTGGRDFAPILEKIIKQSSTIEALSLDRNRLGNARIWLETDPSDVFRGLADAIAQNSHLRRLKLRYNQLSADDVIQLAASFESYESSKLERLYLGGNQIGDAGVGAVLRLLKLNPSIRYLTVSRNGIDPEIWLQHMAPLVDSGRVRIAQMM